MRSLGCNTAIMLVTSIEQAVSFDWIPKKIKHVTSGNSTLTLGLFFPLLFLLFFNYNVVVGVGKEDSFIRELIWTTMTLYLLVGLRGSGELNN